MSSRAIVLAVWTALLALGFAAVLVFGRPLPTAKEELEAAYHPATPVSEAAAVAAAETIVRLEHPTFVGAPRTVSLRSDLGVERYVVVYTLAELNTGLRISINVKDGKVTVATFP